MVNVPEDVPRLLSLLYGKVKVIAVQHDVDVGLVRRCGMEQRRKLLHRLEVEALVAKAEFAETSSRRGNLLNDVGEMNACNPRGQDTPHGFPFPLAPELPSGLVLPLPVAPIGAGQQGHLVRERSHVPELPSAVRVRTRVVRIHGLRAEHGHVIRQYHLPAQQQGHHHPIHQVQPLCRDASTDAGADEHRCDGLHLEARQGCTDARTGQLVAAMALEHLAEVGAAGRGAIEHAFHHFPSGRVGRWRWWLSRTSMRPRHEHKVHRDQETREQREGPPEVRVGAGAAAAVTGQHGPDAAALGRRRARQLRHELRAVVAGGVRARLAPRSAAARHRLCDDGTVSHRSRGSVYTPTVCILGRAPAS
mmetsp:Transcript_13450/g.50017  ORF Transcript_13450/g.50017 Transcript_13450/m.50017 type:complete len:362 (+) Transcript_13450:5419-6504(+)